MPGGGSLRVELCEEQALNRLPKDLRDDKGDNRILAVALATQERYPGETVIFVTKDTNLRIKADAIGLVAEDYESDKVDIQELYAGARSLEIDPEAIDRFYGQGWLEAPEGLLPNEFATLMDSANPSHTAVVPL